MTIYEALKSAKLALSKSGIDSASLDASLILSHLTGYDKTRLITHDDEPLSEELADKFNALIEKRLKGYPVAYILGYKEFWGLKLKVTEDTLIPRPDTETLVQAALDLKVEGPVLDLGTGSGAIILALKSEYQDKIEAFACDVSEKTLAVARENADSLKLKVDFFCSNWFESIPPLKFSLIVSNPPYIRDNDPHLKRTSLPYEPIGALTSGPDGLADIRRIVRSSRDYLKSQASLVIEHGYDQGIMVRAIFAGEGYINVKSICDLEGRERVTMGTLE